MEKVVAVSFAELGISGDVLTAVEQMGFSAPTPIQAHSIPVLKLKKDLIAQAQTGTGKTAAFGIPVVESIDMSAREVQALILCPTRELALQVAKQLGELSQCVRGLDVVSLVGGQPIEPQIRSLKKGTHIVVGTPGRVMDHLDRKTLALGGVRFAVLDEADEMLDMGFRDDIEAILKKTPAERQTALFSATMPKEIKALAQTYQKNPEMINLMPKEVSVAKIEQVYYEVNGTRKFELLSNLLDIDQPAVSIVFCNTIQRVDEVVRKLQEAGYSADALHGDMRQSRRDKVMERFRKSECKVLVATDVAARGIDVAGIEVVFNVDLPMDHENYVHRIGRTGRAGRTGKAYSFVSGRDRTMLRNIQRYINTTIERRDMPSIESVEQARATRIFEKITSIKAAGNLDRYTELVKKHLSGLELTPDITAALLKLLIHKERATTFDAGDYEDSSDRQGRRGGGRFPRRDRGDREGGFDRGERSRSFRGGRSFDGGKRPSFGSNPRFEGRKPRFFDHDSSFSR